MIPTIELTYQSTVKGAAEQLEHLAAEVAAFCDYARSNKGNAYDVLVLACHQLDIPLKGLNAWPAHTLIHMMAGSDWKGSPILVRATQVLHEGPNNRLRATIETVWGDQRQEVTLPAWFACFAMAADEGILGDLVSPSIAIETGLWS